MPFRLAPLKKRVSPSREPWKGVVACETSLPSLAKGQGSDIGAWVPSPKTGHEESLPQIQEIADRIASRYSGGLAKLNEVQRAWRQKQDALQRKRQNRPMGGEEEPILSPSCRDNSSPASPAGSFTAREASREGLQPSSSVVSRRSGSGSTRRSRTTKKTWPRKAEVQDAPEEVPDQVEEKETRIKDVLKSGLGDLFHQKREVYHEDPELHETHLPTHLPRDRQSVLKRSESMRSQGKGAEEEDARFGRGAAVNDADAASVMTSSTNMEDLRMKRPRESVPRKTVVGSLGPLGSFHSRKNTRMVRQQEALQVDDGERHGRQLSFATCSELAKKHRFTVPIVRHALEEFLSLDKNGDGRLSLNEFEQAIRDRCNIAPDEATPHHLLHLNWSKADKDNDSEINFEEFLLWSTEHLFTEELVVNDPQERYMRELARKFNLPLDQVEKCYKTFMNSDSNRNGFIEEGEFRSCVAILWNCDMEDIPATRFRQFWLEADKGRLGKLSFEVFLIWYMTIGVR